MILPLLEEEGWGALREREKRRPRLRHMGTLEASQRCEQRTLSLRERAGVHGHRVWLTEVSLSTGRSRGRFPLTPTLSLREREDNRPRAGTDGASRWVESLAAVPPLPEGEGWDEGERR